MEGQHNEQQSKQTSTPTRINVLMLPWLGYGHLTAFMELAKALCVSTRNNSHFHIYFCSTPVCIQAIKPRLNKLPNSSSAASIQFVELDLPSSPHFDLPPHLHTTNALPSHLIPTLFQAFSSAAKNFEAILQALAPHLLIYDSLQPWAPQIASSLKLPVPAINFSPVGASLLSRVLHAMTPHSSRPTTTPSAGSQQFDLQCVEAMLGCWSLSSSFVLVNSFRELEGKYLDHVPAILNKKVVPIGPLAYEPTSVQEEDEDAEYGSIKKWLDKKEASSTVFISFGSECFPTKEEMEEIGHGLEESGANFIWVVRVPKEETNRSRSGIIELAEGFVERAGEERGMVVEDWAPQGRILKHKSIGGFVSHCGWNSVMESVRLGIPIIGVPMRADQPYNAAVVEEAGVGVEAKRDAEGRIQRAEIGNAIKQVLAATQDGTVRKKVRELSEIVRRNGDGKIDEMVDLICDLLRHNPKI